MFLHFLCIFFNPQPPRDSHPIIRFTCKPVDAVVGSLNFNLPFDKYELEPSPLTQYILEKRQCNTAWQVSFYFLQLVIYNTKILIYFTDNCFENNSEILKSIIQML